MSTISEALKMLKEGDVEGMGAEEAANEILKVTKYRESEKGNLAKLIAFWENETDIMPADAVENYKEAEDELLKKYGQKLVSWVDTYEKGEEDPGDGGWHITVYLKNGEVKKVIGDYEGFLGLSEILEENENPTTKSENFSVSKLGLKVGDKIKLVEFDGYGRYGTYASKKLIRWVKEIIDDNTIIVNDKETLDGRFTKKVKLNSSNVLKVVKLATD